MKGNGMRASKKLLFSAAGLTIAASGLVMGVGSASASVCTTECGQTPLPVLKLEIAADRGAKISDLTIIKVLDKTTPAFF